MYTIMHMYIFLKSCFSLLDICLKEVPSLSDSVYNIHLLREFSNEYLNRCFYMHTEDLLYGPPVLKVRSYIYFIRYYKSIELPSKKPKAE